MYGRVAHLPRYMFGPDGAAVSEEVVRGFKTAIKYTIDFIAFYPVSCVGKMCAAA